MDTNRNGVIEKSEFCDFLGLKEASHEWPSASVLFHSFAKTDNNAIHFQDFSNAFDRILRGESVIDKRGKLQAAIDLADQDRSGTINMHEFLNFMMYTKPNLRIDEVKCLFQKFDIDGTGHIRCSTFKIFIEQQGLWNEPHINKSVCNVEKELRKRLKLEYRQAEPRTKSGILNERWRVFNTSDRRDPQGITVMRGAKDIVSDILPGAYQLSDLLCLHDLPNIKPKHAVVQGVTWIKSRVPDKSGRCLFPGDFNAQIPVEVATTELLAYYGAEIANGNQNIISLAHRHGMIDFTYTNYLEGYVTAEHALNGAGLEKHEFSHLNCPLDDDSGYSVLAKFTDDNEGMSR